ncbi:hypothetical protein R1flu_007080 [Riccia fluitans]|uniref:Uncharacterized protein n=1 Tax=Riccia fluitans TaxID=41844 RepID=A0ABD1YYF0_9MARC
MGFLTIEGAYAGGCQRLCGGFEFGTAVSISSRQVLRYSPPRVLHRFTSRCCLSSSRFLGHHKVRETLFRDDSHEGKRSGVFAKCVDDGENQHEIRVCTNRSCRQLGSLQTLDVLRSLAPANVAVESCGCLGNCGAGPNLVILPAELVVRHCSTAVHAARLLELQCGAADPDTNLKALYFKERGNKSFQQGDHEQAELYYSEAIELNPSGGLHFLYSNRSAVRLARGDVEGALDDAEQAIRILPKWPVAYLRKADVYLQMGDLDNAQLSCSSALRLDPSLRRSKSFQAKVKKITERLELVRVSA